MITLTLLLMSVVTGDPYVDYCKEHHYSIGTHFTEWYATTDEYKAASLKAVTTEQNRQLRAAIGLVVITILILGFLAASIYYLSTLPAPPELTDQQKHDLKYLKLLGLVIILRAFVDNIPRKTRYYR